MVSTEASKEAHKESRRNFRPHCKPHILIIDDDPSLVDIVSALMEHDGYHVYKALCGKDGLHEYARHRPDILVLDLHMGGMTGYEVMHKIRTVERILGLVKPLPILIITGAAEAAEMVNTPAGANGVLLKPFLFDELLTKIDELLRQPHQHKHKK